MDRNIIVRTGDDEIHTTLAAFLADNEFDWHEEAEMRFLLAKGTVYRGGGGAAPEFSIVAA